MRHGKLAVASLTVSLPGSMYTVPTDAWSRFTAALILPPPFH